MHEQNMVKYDNPGKAFLWQYRCIMRRCESLKRAIDEYRERATDCTVKLNPMKVQGGGSVYDRMAEDACKAADISTEMSARLKEAEQILPEILAAIDAVPDEQQKMVLTMRYIEGASWTDIQERIGYEKTQAYVIHGKALLWVNKWLEMKNIGAAG